MLIGSRQKLNTLTEPPHLLINDTSVKQVFTTKTLGVIVDNNLMWHDQIDKLSKKIASGIGAIKRIRAFVPPGVLHLVFNALVQPNFDYWK